MAWIVCVWAVSQGCSSEIVNANCPDAGSASGGPALLVRLHDADGDPAALGTTVRLDGPGPDQAVTGRDPDGSVIAIGNRPGKFDVIITRPGWVSPPVREIRVAAPEEICDGLQTIQLFATLALRPDAPAVRQVVPEADHVTIVSDPPFPSRLQNGRRQLRAFIEADPTASTEVEWIATQPEIADVTPDGMVTVRCRESSIDTHVVARSRADPDVTASVRVTVEKTTLLSCPVGS